MRRISLPRQRQLFGYGLLGVAAFATYWTFFSAGIPVFWGPSASAAEIAAGRELFEHEWEPNDPLAHGDGLGPVFNARSCAACHFQGGLGGGGELQHNALAFEVLPRPGSEQFVSGTIHNFSVRADHQETSTQVRKLFPKISLPPQVVRGCGTPAQTIPRQFDPLHTESLQATALFGAGWIDLMSGKAIRQQRRQRVTSGAIHELSLDFAEVPVGRVRTLPDGRVGKFGWKAQFATLEEFVGAACANELGLGTPNAEQAKPLADSNYQSAPDLDRKQFRNLVAFVKTLPRPVEAVPDGPAQKETVARGKELFTSVGCAICHVPDMGGVNGVYSDFLLYTLDDPTPQGGGGGYGSDPPPELELPTRPEDDPKPSEWKTPALWGVADSAPYMHDGASATLEEAILRHRGDARTVSDAYTKLGPDGQAAITAFLKTLKAPPDAKPLSNAAVTRLAMAKK